MEEKAPYKKISSLGLYLTSFFCNFPASFFTPFRAFFLARLFVSFLACSLASWASCLIVYPAWLSPVAFASEITTNETTFSNSPPWLTRLRVNRVVAQVQRYLEWDIRRVNVQWYDHQENFQKFHGYDSTVLAVSKKQDNSIHIGPRVTAANFDAVFGHELVHVILFQKFNEAIPKWLEEGLANYISKGTSVDYSWLASQPDFDVRTLVHPFLDPSHQGASAPTPKYHYQASTGLIEMIASRCRLNDLLQLSIGTHLERYLSTFCHIDDVNAEFRKWVRKKMRGRDERPAGKLLRS